MPKESRRTKMTRNLLNDSFWWLLEQKPLRKITVKEICQVADVNRSTYYQYYTDPYDQAQQQEKELIGTMLAFTDRYCLRAGEILSYDQLYPVVKDTLDYIYANRHRFRILLGDHSGINLQVDMIAAYIKKLQPETAFLPLGQDACPQKCIFYSSGSFAIIYHWLQTSDTTPTTKVAEWITGFVQNA